MIRSVSRRRRAAAAALTPLLMAAVASGLSACAPAPAPAPQQAPALTLERLNFDQLQGWMEDRHEDALVAFKRSCQKQDGASPRVTSMTPAAFGSADHWRIICAAARGGHGDGAARAFFETHFQPYRAGNNGRSDGLFTGYYEPELTGNTRKTVAAHVPLYRLPDDLVTIDLARFDEAWTGRQLTGRLVGRAVVPMPTRAEIAGGALDGRGLELVWVTDPIEAFFLHIQGSGKVVLDDGRIMRVGFAGKNGHPYVAIGRELVRRGALPKDDVSLQSIRDWLRANPEQAPAVMALNPSFVFFRVLHTDGPVGAQGVVLTPGRSLAVDPAYVPLGVPLWLETSHPLRPGEPLRRLVVAQDTGGAIKGPVRGDLFWGSGPEAEEAAGRMNERGQYVLLLPKMTLSAH